MYFPVIGCVVEWSASDGALHAARSSFDDPLRTALASQRLRGRLPRGKLQPGTPKTISTSRQLFPLLAEVRARGFALDDEATVIGLRSVAAIIQSSQSRP